MTSALIARAKIDDPAKRQAYGDWHSKRVFNEIIKEMSSQLIAARRGWSLTSPEIHISAYWFADEASMKAAAAQAAPKYVEILDKEFPDVTRTLEQITTAEEWTKGMAEA